MPKLKDYLDDLMEIIKKFDVKDIELLIDELDEYVDELYQKNDYYVE